MAQPKPSADQIGGIEHANLNFVASYAGQTTNATPTEIFIDGVASDRLDIPDNTTVLLDIQVVARRTDAAAQSAAYAFHGFVRRDVGAASTVVSFNPVSVKEDVAGWDVVPSANTTSGSLVLTVTGEAAKTIEWRAVVSFVVLSQA